MTRPWVVFSAVSLVLIGSAVAYGAHWWHKTNEIESFALSVTGVKDLPERESRFAKAPTIDDCVILLDKYGHVLDNPSKAIPFGEQCLILPKSEPVAYVIHYWLAEYYNRLDQSQKARLHLEAALKSDTESIIVRNNWIQQANLGRIYASLQTAP